MRVYFFIKMRIFLVGMPASGKSFLARKIAEKNKLRFFDTDCLVADKYKTDIADIFAKFGEEAFRQAEQEVLHELLSRDNYIAATGGGLPCFYDNMKQINESGISIYLRTSVGELIRRIGKSDKRPLLKGKNAKELEIYLKNTLEIREKFYLQAKYIVDTELNIDILLSRISRLFKK